MEDAAARRHPLHVAGGQSALVAETIAMIDSAGQNIGDGLDSPVGMPGEAGAVVVRVFVAEIVEEQKRVEVARLTKPEGAAQMHASPFNGGLRFDNPFYGSNGHGICLSVSGFQRKYGWVWVVSLRRLCWVYWSACDRVYGTCFLATHVHQRTRRLMNLDRPTDNGFYTSHTIGSRGQEPKVNQRPTGAVPTSSRCRRGRGGDEF